MTEVIHLIDRNDKNFPNPVCGLNNFKSVRTDQITLTTCERCLNSVTASNKFTVERMKRNLGHGQHSIKKGSRK